MWQRPSPTHSLYSWKLEAGILVILFLMIKPILCGVLCLSNFFVCQRSAWRMWCNLNELEEAAKLTSSGHSNRSIPYWRPRSILEIFRSPCAPIARASNAQTAKPSAYCILIRRNFTMSFLAVATAIMHISRYANAVTIQLDSWCLSCDVDWFRFHLVTGCSQRVTENVITWLLASKHKNSKYSPIKLRSTATSSRWSKWNHMTGELAVSTWTQAVFIHVSHYPQSLRSSTLVVADDYCIQGRQQTCWLPLL